MQDFDGPPPTLGKGEDVVAAIARIREHGKKLAAELARIRSAGLTGAECKKRMRVQVEELAQRGIPSVTPLCRYGREITWPTQLMSSRVFNGQGGPTIASTEAPDMLAVLAFALKDSLIKQLDAKIDAEADDSNAMAPDVRERREAEALANIVANDRIESALVWRAQDEGLPIEHRADVSPDALLGLVVVTVPAALPSGTTRGMSWAH